MLAHLLIFETPCYISISEKYQNIIKAIYRNAKIVLRTKINKIYSYFLFQYSHTLLLINI